MTGGQPSARRGGLRLLKVASCCGRARGLLGRKPPGPRSGILLMHCAAVHTFGMRYAIDVAFISRQGRVLAVRRALAPCRMASCLGAVAVVEMRAGVLDTEYGGIGRIEAAVQHATRGDIEGNLQRAGKLGRQADGDQEAGAQVDEKKHQDPGGAVDQERQLVAPAGDAGEEQRLDQAQPMPGDQDGGVPEQRGDHDIHDREQSQRNGHGRQDGLHGLFHGGNAHALDHRVREWQEDDQAGRNAERRVQQPHQEQFPEYARLLERLGPHRGQHDAVGFDMLARR
ncbi:DUF192 domain-containing protein [Achromobacter sp. ACM02]|nr:DUF192 domain-containing protein [Achromobacter sp. ACM02]